jgi:hypothetical protein
MNRIREGTCTYALLVDVNTPQTDNRSARGLGLLPFKHTIRAPKLKPKYGMRCSRIGCEECEQPNRR